MLRSCHPGCVSDERSSLGLTGLALPAADTARPVSVQRSVCNAAGLSARRTPGTANRAAEPTKGIFSTSQWFESCLRNHKKYKKQLAFGTFCLFQYQKVRKSFLLIFPVALTNSTLAIALQKTRAKPIQNPKTPVCICSFWDKKVMREFLRKKDMRKFL